MKRGDTLASIRRRRKCLHVWKFAHELDVEDQCRIVQRHPEYLRDLSAFQSTRRALTFDGRLDRRCIEITG